MLHGSESHGFKRKVAMHKQGVNRDMEIGTSNM